MKQIECVVVIDKKMIIKVNAPPREKSVLTSVKEMDTRVWTLELMEACLWNRSITKFNLMIRGAKSVNGPNLDLKIFRILGRLKEI